MLVRMVRSGPEAAAWDVVVDSCSVRAKHGGELTGPNPTDRGKPGTKYHVAVATDGIPLAALPSAANVHDTRLFPGLLSRAMVVCVAIARLYADASRRSFATAGGRRSSGTPRAGYNSAANRALCWREGIEPVIRQSGEPQAPVSGRSAMLSRTSTLGFSPTSAWIAGTTGQRSSSTRCSPQPALG